MTNRGVNIATPRIERPENAATGADNIVRLCRSDFLLSIASWSMVTWQQWREGLAPLQTSRRVTSA
jgi:hypothetical protein